MHSLQMYKYLGTKSTTNLGLDYRTRETITKTK
jgi:hypothetical protein